MTTLRSSVVAKHPITNGLIAMVRSGISKPVGDHEAPENADLDVGYAIAYTIDGGSFEGAPLWATESDAWLVYQITSVGRKRDQAEAIADRVRLTILSRVAAGGFQVAFPDPAGMKVTGREPDGTSPGVIPEGVKPNRVYNVPERYRFHVEST